MHKEYHRWFSSPLGREMGVAVYGHYGMPLLAFPTSGGDEWEQEQRGMIDALSGFLDRGVVKIFAVDSVSADSFYNKGAHPFHRSWMQAQYDVYIRQEVVPFVHAHCLTLGLPIATFGASLGAYHAANALFKHPDVFTRCFALSGVYDLSRFMDGTYDDNFYFNNPVDYLSNISDPWYLERYSQCDIHLATGCGPWEDSGPTYRLSRILASRQVPHALDDWGSEGGHDWPYWHRQMWEYLGRTFA
jgi:esterase/lipase superfamily enzyme